MESYTDELYHHGALGMKWGHRKGSQIKVGSKYYEDDYNNAIDTTDKMFKTVNEEWPRASKEQAHDYFENRLFEKAFV